MTRTVDIDPRSVLVMLGAFVALIAVTGAIRSIPRTSAAVAIALLLTLALNPLVEAIQRRLGVARSPAVAVVLAGFVVVATAVALLLVPPAIHQAQDLGKELPTVVADLGRLPIVGERLRDAEVPQKVEAWIDQLPERLAGDTTPLKSAAGAIADGLLAGTVTMMLALALLVDAESLLGHAGRLVPPRHRRRARHLASLAYEVVGRYVAGSLLVAAIAGLSVLIVGTILGVPLAPLAAAWVMLWDLVPQIGGAMGGIPFVLLGFTEGPTTGVICAIFFILYLQFENNFLSPLVVGKAVKLSPPATMAAALIGVSAGGVVGALLAVPAVGAAKAVYLEIRPPRVVVEADASSSKSTSAGAED